MKITMRKLHKIRVIVKEPMRETLGISLPENLKKWNGVWCYVEEKGNTILLSSGALPNIFDLSTIKKISEEEEKVKI